MVHNLEISYLVISCLTKEQNISYGTLTTHFALRLQVWSAGSVWSALLHSFLPHFAGPFFAAGLAGRAHFVHPRASEQANLWLPSLFLVGEIEV
jgi:hypothetical protein